MKKSIVILLSVISILVLLTSCASAAGSLNTKKLSPLFSQNGSGDWVYQWSSSSSDSIMNMYFVITDIFEKKCLAIYGLVYYTSGKNFLKLNGYKITIDGHTYDISDCSLNYSFGTNLGEVECPFAVDSSFYKMFVEMKNAKKEIKIIEKIALGEMEITLESTLSNNTNGFKELKKMAQAVFDSGLFNLDLDQDNAYSTATVIDYKE